MQMNNISLKKIVWIICGVQFFFIVAYVYHHNKCIQLYRTVQIIKQKNLEQEELCKESEHTIALCSSHASSMEYAEKSGMEPLSKKHIIVIK